MKISSRYTVALQLLCIFEIYRDNKITSNFIAEKTGADSSTIRYIMLDLKKRNYVESRPGPGGTKLCVPLNTISLYDVYELVADPEDSLLNFCTLPETASHADKIIQSSINQHFESYKNEMFEKMRTQTVADIYYQIQQNLISHSVSE